MQQRRMLFIKPPSLDMGEVAKGRKIHYGTIPYGILSIITYVNEYKTTDATLSILDLNTMPYDRLGDYIKGYQPDVIGLSVMYNHIYPYISKITDTIKDINKDIIVIAGGACVMAYHEQILRETQVDAICYSEGEIPVLNLIDSDNMADILETHPSFLTKEGLLNGKKPHATFVENLDSIPLVDFGLIDLVKYNTKYDVFRPYPVENEMCLPITTTRGCPYNCVFCIAGDLHGKKVRKASARKIVSDAKEMKEKYGMNVLSIEDDQSMIDRHRAKEMLLGLAELNIGLWMISGFTVSLIDYETIHLLKLAGLQVATLPIESGSPYVLKHIIDKPIRLSQVEDVVKQMHKEGIMCHANIVIGFPGETDEHRRESVAFIKNSDIDWCYVFCATALKGSRLYSECAEKGYIDTSQMITDGYCVSNINTPDFAAEEITKKAYLMNLELNFVNNNRMRKGDYETAIRYFKHVVNKYPNHAIAYYCLSLCYKDYDDKSFNLRRYNEIIATSPEWKEYAEHFNL